MSAKLILIGAGVVGVAVGFFSLPARDDAEFGRQSAGEWAVGSDVHYVGCNEVRALGKAPLYYDQPGYDPKMDGDGDGIACEPHH
jgi:hypothetical protein